MSEEKFDLGLIGLAVMGQNLVLNIAEKGYSVAVYNRTPETARRFIEERSQGLRIRMAETLRDFVSLLKKPRIVLIMVKAGEPVDEVLSALLSYLEPGDLVADLGNSFFKDTERRAKALSELKLIYMGIGISGGEEGALKGPSIMPGGAEQGWQRLKSILEKISARVNGSPCVCYIGPAGAGHFVKMVHNGIEYGDMQIIAESYDILRTLGKMTNDELARVYERFNRGVLNSYLIEITARIFREKDKESGKAILDLISDRAGQKGTGQWTCNTAFELSEPVPTISSALEARNLSGKKGLRVVAEKFYKIARRVPVKGNLVKMVEDAMYCSKLSLYSQGMSLIRTGSREFSYNINFSELARIWKGGCIIRASLLDLIQKIFAKNPELENLLLSTEFRNAIKKREKNWRRVIGLSASSGIPCPAMGASLSYFDSIRKSQLPANLIQAQRDFFGAHQFERIDRQGVFHHSWKK